MKLKRGGRLHFAPLFFSYARQPFSMTGLTKLEKTIDFSSPNLISHEPNAVFLDREAVSAESHIPWYGIYYVQFTVLQTNSIQLLVEVINII